MLRFKKNERFYHIYKQPNLFGEITIICSWGTFDSNRCGSKKTFCSSEKEGKQLLETLKLTRLKRGYKPY